MPLSRREFVASAASLAAAAAPLSAASHGASDAERQAAPVTRGGAEDPLGVRGDFPIVRDRHYLNSAYITPVPNQVVAAGRAFLERKAASPIPLGDMRSLRGSSTPGPTRSAFCSRPARARTSWPTDSICERATTS